ncbi:hypothetical protein CHLNCDRAFT_141703 [Chlorella variabilis]|uniref:Uncharacterized protein n=1 Tax=Chlorella variabilis TaxID=554065 RepID=E1ZTE7_CHLVA|nr:hypothetical protein CHLNCDRAFT_141703 [Chlorella variabilis]EFN50888.1 hypothetical protein CHLNCDRAFT_141703 [Chlorella variabilis]|eukprot:XP_005842990.1 hypothetical protein CHLNCDRAFT_141703 [Chlorella variabilis]
MAAGAGCSGRRLQGLQRWIRPDPQDFAKADAGHRGRSPTEGEYFDINAADPTDMLENVCVSSLLHAPDGGIESPAVRPGSAGTSSQTASGERSGMRSAG